MKPDFASGDPTGSLPNRVHPCGRPSPSSARSSPGRPRRFFGFWAAQPIWVAEQHRWRSQRARWEARRGARHLRSRTHGPQLPRQSGRPRRRPHTALRMISATCNTAGAAATRLHGGAESTDCCRQGGTAARRPSSTAAQRPGGPAARQHCCAAAGQPAARQHGCAAAPEARRHGSTAAQRSGGLAARQHGCAVARQHGCMLAFLPPA
jgi:hypothetical protein